MTSQLSYEAPEVTERIAVDSERGRKQTKCPSYQYEPLPEGDHIRTLVLQPGSGDEPLQCDLNISEMNKVTFEAISYVWGSNNKDHEITCNGQLIPITTNLWTVLRHVRSDSPRVLWADSICIDQEHFEEKAHQVAMMGRIFRSAERVLIYIGDDDMGHGEHVSSLLDDMRDMIESGLKQAGSVRGAFPWPGDAAPILKDLRWESYFRLLRESWFDRGWVVQEAAVARTGRLLWGRHELSWEDVMRTESWLRARALKLWSNMRRDISAHRILYQHRWPAIARVFHPDTTSYGLLYLLHWARSLRFSDPRDRVFAFAELAQDFERHVAVQPNYNISFLRVYQHFATDYIRSTGDTELLDRVCHDEDSLHCEVPSWVPQWNVVGSSLAQPRNSSWPPLKPHKVPVREPEIIEDCILKVQGVIIDAIVYESDTMSNETTTLETTSNLWKDIAAIQVDSPYPSTNRVQVFLESLVCGTYDGEWSKWTQSGEALALFLQANHSDQNQAGRLQEESGVENADRFLSHAKDVTHNSKFVLTERGYMGLAPCVARIGDMCAIIFGCTTSCILRKAKLNQQYQVLGSAVFMGKQPQYHVDGAIYFEQLGDERSKDWIEWDVEEQDIDLC